MTIRLVDKGWTREVAEAVAEGAGAIRLISPFIKTGALRRFLYPKPKSLQVITRFNLRDFAEGVSDIAALRMLLDAGATVRGVKNLHAKLYLFGSTRAIVTSANLTEAALSRNHEFGFVSQDAEVIATCGRYFDDLWSRGGADLTPELLDRWDQVVTHHRASGGRPDQQAGLADFGADAGFVGQAPFAASALIADAPQAFVKFLGQSSDRVPLTFSTIEEIKRAGCHWAVAYPATKRPRNVKDDAIMFIGRLTHDPHDIRVFGRAIGMRHVPVRDDATDEDIALRSWKATWPRYVRVHHAEFVAGTMANGVSLNALMEELGASCFEATKRNAASGIGNTNPRRAYLQQAAVELSPEGQVWLAARLQTAFDKHGVVPNAELAGLDWPNVPDIQLQGGG